MQSEPTIIYRFEGKEVNLDEVPFEQDLPKDVIYAGILKALRVILRVEEGESILRAAATLRRRYDRIVFGKNLVHITDDDEGIREVDLRIALNEIALKKLNITWDTEEGDYRLTVTDPSGLEEVCSGPYLLSVLQQLASGPR